MAGDPHRPRPPPNRRRDKVQLSCDPCRHSKLRCNRQRPCGACSRRGLINTCNYAATSSSTPEAGQSAAPRQSSHSLQARISELESLVVNFMRSGSLPSSSAPESPKRSPPSFADVVQEIRRPEETQNGAASRTDPGTLQLREAGTSYVQSVHWEAILVRIRGLKEDLVTDGKAASGSQLFYGPSRHATRDEVLAAIPPRPTVDRLMALHFDSYIITPYFIHRKQFLREYEAFWQDPSTISISWISLMFSMLYTAAHLQIFTIDYNDAGAESTKAGYLTMKEIFREKAVQCLILARYTMGGAYVLEALLTILTGEFVLSKDGAADGWLSISSIFHLALRMGYHRDPDHFPGISAFEGEMRRRVWATILSLDLILSLEMGLPRNATDTHIDTRQPLNLRDCDFDEDSTELPLPRSESEWTPVLPLIARGRLLTALGLICDINTNTKPSSCEDRHKVGKLLEDVYNRAIPPLLRWETKSHPITDSPSVVVQRVSIETTYHKARILLYRKALIRSPAQQFQGRDRDSVRLCLDSALQILSFQQTLHEESQPFGRLCQLRWKVIRIFYQDVLLATSVLCLYLQDVDKFGFLETARQRTSLSRAEETRQRLIVSHSIWLQMSTTSAEAGKVAKALSIVLGKTGMRAEEGDEPAHYDSVADIDAAPLNEFGALFDNQYFSSGFYSPLAFFENVLEARRT